MGTNYYVGAEPTCDNPEHNETLHIGKSSAGWKFGFHGIPERGLTSWKAWREYLVDKVVMDEYGRERPDFVDVVEKREAPAGLSRLICRVEPNPEEIRVGFGGYPPLRDGREYHDSEGYDFFDGDFS